MTPEDPPDPPTPMAYKNSGPDMRRVFGDNVRKIREQRSLSQEALALEVGVDQAYFSRIERGGTNPTIEMIERIARALNVSPAQLFGANDDE